MTLHIELPEELEKRVSGAAERHNLPVEAYVAYLIDSKTAPKRSFATKSPEDFSSYLKSLALFNGNTPNYPPDFWTREIVSDDGD